MTDPVKITLEDQIRCVGRELGMRRNVYPRFVKSGRITQEQADYEIAAMEHVYATMKEIREDALRLDYLEQEANKEPLLLHSLETISNVTAPRGLGLKVLGRTLRQAIDAMRGK